MLNPDLFYAARWSELYTFFAAGSPPLVLQLLLINTAFLVFFIVRRLRGRTRPRSQSAFVVQGFLIAANVTLMFAPDFAKTSGEMVGKYSKYDVPGSDRDLNSLVQAIVGK